jgi:redox-sensitive bicupin YhaK (pirin superfamily)
MNKVLHPAHSRGAANHGWLKSFHSFSFANYYNPQKMHFGVLRVLNDDEVAPSMGFGTHPHDNMEIISIPLSGELKHKDSMGNEAIIKTGEIQVMSAGTGIQHSEFNASTSDPVKFLQIWLFPNTKNVTPRYDQIQLPDLATHNHLQQVLSPNAEDAGVWIHQNAWFHMGTFDAGTAQSYTLKDARNGLYLFMIEGSIEIEGETLGARDAIGLSDLNEVSFTSTSENTRVLLMEVPMHLS